MDKIKESGTENAQFTKEIEHLKQIAPENLSLKIEELMFKIKTLEENRDQINQALNRTQN